MRIKNNFGSVYFFTMHSLHFVLQCIPLLKRFAKYNTNRRDCVDLNKENTKKLRNLIVFTVLLYLGVRNLGMVADAVGFVMGFMIPFIVGGAIAFILNVPMKFIERNLFGKIIKKKNKATEKLDRPVSLILAIFVVIAVIMVVILVVAPEFANTAASVVKKIEENIPVMQEWLKHTFSKNPQILEWANSLEFNPQQVIDSVGTTIKNGVNNFLSSTVSLTMGIVSTAMNIGIGFIFACYILLQKEKLGLQTRKALYAIFPEKVVVYFLHVWTLANRTFANFITGQCIEAVILGSMFFVTMTIFRFPYAMLVGVLISFTALIPVFGGFIGCWIGFLLILMVSPVKAITFLGLFLVLQQIEGNLIYPHVVGNSVGLPSIWVLMAVTLGGSLMGVLGMLVFIPLVSVIYTLFREWMYKRLKEKKIEL